MKLKLIPVALVAAFTSLLTVLGVVKFQSSIPFLAAHTQSAQLPVNYAHYTGNVAGSPAAPVNFEMAATASVKAVVHIKTTTKARTVSDDNSDDVFSQMFGQRQYYVPSQVESGSGVIVSPDGFIVTNNHVIANGDDVTVTFNDRYTKTAKVVAKDPSTDLALLKVDGDNSLPYMELGNSDDVKLGQWVLAVGYPLSLEATVTAGIVSAKGRSIGINRRQSQTAIESFIQTDAAVNPGNSGGALVNTDGQLIGINSAIASPTGSYAGYSYAIPVNIVRKVVNDMRKYGSVQRAFMGIEYLDSKNATPEQLSQYHLDRNEGIYVMNVVPNGGAAAAGIKTGDFITEVNGQPVATQPQLQEQIARYQPGDNISVKLVRDGKPMIAEVKLNKAEGPVTVLGAAMRPLSSREAASLDVAGGVLVTSLGNGLLSKATKMHRGFVITSVNGHAVASVAELQRALEGDKDVQLAGVQPGYNGMYYYSLKGADIRNGQ